MPCKILSITEDFKLTAKLPKATQMDDIAFIDLVAATAGRLYGRQGG
jgi:hypothetical protein